jgi:hypothetical protein
MKKILIALLFISSSAFASGELLVSSQSIVPNVVPKEGIGIPILKLNLTAKNEDVAIEKLVFKRTGLSDSQDVESIRATGKNVYSRSFPMLTNDTATINFFGKFIIPADTTETITVTANLNVQGMGRTIALNLIEIVSSASSNTLGESSTIAQENITQSSSFSEKNIEIEKMSFTPSRLRLERWQKLGKFRLKNPNKQSVELDSFYLHHDGTGSLNSIFYNVILTSENSVVSYSTRLSDRTAIISFLDGINIEGNSDRLIDIWGKVKRNKSSYSVDFNAENEDVISK